MSQHLCLNTCFPVSSLGVSTPVLVSQHLILNAKKCLNVKPTPLSLPRSRETSTTSTNTGKHDETRARLYRLPTRNPARAVWIEDTVLLTGLLRQPCSNNAATTRRCHVPGARWRTHTSSGRHGACGTASWHGSQILTSGLSWTCRAPRRHTDDSRHRQPVHLTVQQHGGTVDERRWLCG